jgi:hypothetical protein
MAPSKASLMCLYWDGLVWYCTIGFDDMLDSWAVNGGMKKGLNQCSGLQ